MYEQILTPHLLVVEGNKLGIILRVRSSEVDQLRQILKYKVGDVSRLL